MTITDVRIKTLNNPKSNIVAMADVTLDNELVIHNVKIIKAGDKTFIAMPHERVESKNKKTFQDVVHPITTEARQMFNDEIIGKYELIIAEESGD